MTQAPPPESPPPSVMEPYVMAGVAIRPESHHVERGPAEHYSMPAPQAEHLRQQERDKAVQELKKDMARFWAGLFVVLSVFGIAVFMLLRDTNDAWARSALTTLLGLAIPFILPKK